MEDFEFLVLMAAGGTALFGWARWLHAAALIGMATWSFSSRLPLLLAPFASVSVMIFVLSAFADEFVRGDLFYTMFYTVLGLAWVGVVMNASPFLGLCPRDDSVERGNSAASTALFGIVLGHTYCYSGGNIGDGPGWWVVVFSAFLASGTLMLIWLLIEHTGRLSDSITIDRNLPVAFRFSGLMQGCGLILGRAVAGDWESYGATVIDFLIFGWPVVILVMMEIAWQAARRAQGKPLRHSAVDIFVGGVYFATALAYILMLGWWL